MTRPIVSARMDSVYMRLPIVASHARWRKAIVPHPTGDLADASASSDNPDSSWAVLLKRVFDIDVLTCEQCGGALRIIAVITDPQVVRKILGHLGLPTRPPPRSPSQALIAS